MAKIKMGNVKGPKGDTGARGSLWRVSDKMTGQSTSDTAFPGANISESVVGDMCLNPLTCDIYKCTAGGDAANAKWVWVMNNRGPQGEPGPKGEPTTVDAVLSKDSTNPIQNKAVAVKFQDVQDSLDRWSSATLNKANATSGSVGFLQIGKSVYVSIWDLRIPKGVRNNDNSFIIASGLPKVSTDAGLLVRHNGTPLRVRLNQDGQLCAHYPNEVPASDSEFYGFIRLAIR